MVSTDILTVRPAGVPIAEAGGLPPVRAAAPRFNSQDTAVTIGNSPRVGDNDWSGDVLWKRVVASDPRSGWWLALPAKLLPRQVEQIKRAGLGGDLWQQWQLDSLMLDSWPMYRKCAHELRQAISNCRFIVRARAEEGEDPTPTAVEKAALVRRAMHALKPDPFTDETAHAGIVYHLCDAILNGVSMMELQWQQPVKGGAGMEVLPKAASWLHPRHYTFTTEGKLTVYGESSTGSTLDFRKGVVGLGLSEEDKRNKFLCGQFLSRSGSALGAGLMRPLATWWSYWVYGREWVAVMAQKYGTPFLHASYKPGGTTDAERNAIEARMRDAGANNYMLYPEGTILNVVAAQNLGPDNPIIHLMRQADEACQYLLLGQTGTTQATPGKLGGEDAHGEVKRENVEAGAGWVGAVLSEQFASSVLRMNYGEDSECPTVEADFTEISNPQEQASRWAILTGMNMPPVMLEEFYKDNSLTQPEPGDVVAKNGQVGLMPNADVEVNAVPMEMMPPMGGPGADDGDQSGQLPQDFDEEEDEEAVAARHMDKIRKVLARASDGELEDLRELTVKARGSNNGEHAAIKARFEEIELCRR